MSASPSPKIWRLLAPDWAELDTVWRHELPFVLWPVGHQPLLAHWMDEAVRGGAERVELYVVDRAEEVRAWLKDGAYWSRQVSVITLEAEDSAPAGAVSAHHLPGLPAPALPCSAAALPAYWFELQKQWLAQRSPEQATVDRVHPSGGWVGPQARIHPSARLTAPFWIGRHAQIGENCRIGPNVLVGEGAIIDDGAEVEHACVLPWTYLGRNTTLLHSAASGSMLLDFRRAYRIDIDEAFIMGPVIDRSSRSGTYARTAALCCRLYTALQTSAVEGQGWSQALRSL